MYVILVSFNKCLRRLCDIECQCFIILRPVTFKPLKEQYITVGLHFPPQFDFGNSKKNKLRRWQYGNVVPHQTKYFLCELNLFKHSPQIIIVEH